MRRVSFAGSDIEGCAALLIRVEHEDGSVQTVKLTKDELEDAAEVCPVSDKVAPADYSSVRECIGHFIGRRIEDITQHDAEEWNETHRSYVQLLLEGGDYLKFYVGAHGFSYSEDAVQSKS
jgi:hypothetical protein